MRLVPAIAAATCGGLLSAAAADDGTPGASVLQQHCLQCHGPATRQGDLDLSSRESALRGGSRGPAIALAEPHSSLVLARVLADEMPPGNPLPAGRKEELRNWIANGAIWPDRLEERRAGLDWWSFQPLRNSAAPDSESASLDWLASPIDRWILAGLESTGLRPAPDASRQDWIRRATFSMTGLPPTPEEVSSFLSDNRPQAHERVVDRLLASPHYGERWARHWLDLVRFAESEGFERDLPRYHAWPYRDYVVRSLNSDKPYAQFAREQIAGDVQAHPTRDSVVATSMLTLGPVDAVGLTSAIPEERDLIREDMLEEMVGTVTQAFLGLTVNCARCHDHKFDPIPQEEYYRIKAVFQGVWPPTRPVPSLGLDALFPHGRAVLTPAEEGERESLVADLDARVERVEEELSRLYRTGRPEGTLSALQQPVARWTFDSDGRADFAPLHLRFIKSAVVSAGRFQKRDRRDSPGSGDPANDDPEKGQGFGVSRLLDREIRAKTLEAWIDVASPPESSSTVMEIRGLSGYRGAPIDGIRYEAGDRSRWENYSVGRFRSKDTGAPPEQLPAGARVHVAITYAEDGKITIYKDGERYGDSYRPDARIPAGRLQAYRPGDATVRFIASSDLHVAEARLYDRALTAAQIAASHDAGILEVPRAAMLGRLNPGQRREVARLEETLARLRQRLERMPAPALAHSASIRPSGPTHLLIRGSVSDPGEQVVAGSLSCINGLSGDLALDSESSDSSRRRAMAEWIASSENPLFARVIVNRVWQAHFGRGFVDNPSDFGYNGGEPSHPELLDRLASDLVRQGWSLKALHRSILLSKAYRQASRFDSEAALKDAENRRLWRFPHRRLDAESVRDSMLAVSGDLNRRFYGESFRPFEYGEARGSLKRYLLTDRDDPDTRRRSLYRMNVITAPDPLLESLDCPLPSVKTPQRRSTTTPLQSLSLMNNAFVQQRSAGFAARLRAEARSLEDQISRAFELALGRSPSPPEIESSRALAQRHGLESLCWGLLNASEFLYVR